MSLTAAARRDHVACRPLDVLVGAFGPVRDVGGLRLFLAPPLYALGGFLVGGAVAVIYNIAAGILGGLELQFLEEDQNGDPDAHRRV